MLEKISIPSLTVVLFIIELSSLVYYTILWKGTRSRSALVFTYATLYMVAVNITGFAYSSLGNIAVWKVYICMHPLLWPFFAYAVSVFEDQGAKAGPYALSALLFFLISFIGTVVFGRDIIALQASAASMALGLGYGSYRLLSLDGKIHSAGRLVGAVVFAVYALTGIARAMTASLDLSWERHFYIDQTGIQSLYFLVSVVFASLLPITVYVLHNERINDALKRSAATLAEEKRKLQVSLEEIKTLRGIIPICMKCKKIRNDEGFWEDVAIYIHNHSYADMSHGICPDCLKEMYPDVYEKMAREGRLGR